MHKILVLDDEEFICKLIVKIASKKGYQVDTSNNYNQAKKYIEEGNYYDFVFIDYNVDKNKLRDFYQKIREKKDNAKIILMSGLEENDLETNLHYDNYIYKPQLIDLINKII